MNAHSPTPWTHFENGIGSVPLFEKGKADGVATCTMNGNAEADAALIVRCVNAHDELVAALRGLLECHLSGTKRDSDAVAQARAALAKAQS